VPPTRMREQKNAEPFRSLLHLRHQGCFTTTETKNPRSQAAQHALGCFKSFAELKATLVELKATLVELKA
jgi:hypothetical protein